MTTRRVCEPERLSVRVDLGFVLVAARRDHDWNMGRRGGTYKNPLDLAEAFACNAVCPVRRCPGSLWSACAEHTQPRSALPMSIRSKSNCLSFEHCCADNRRSHALQWYYSKRFRLPPIRFLRPRGRRCGLGVLVRTRSTL